MAIKKPEWRIYFRPETPETTHVLFKHMKTNIAFQVGVEIGFKFSDSNMVELINRINKFSKDREKEIIEKYGEIPPALCFGQIQNYNDFMLIYKNAIVELGEKGLTVVKLDSKVPEVPGN